MSNPLTTAFYTIADESDRELMAYRVAVLEFTDELMDSLPDEDEPTPADAAWLLLYEFRQTI